MNGYRCDYCAKDTETEHDVGCATLYEEMLETFRKKVVEAEKRIAELETSAEFFSDRFDEERKELSEVKPREAMYKRELVVALGSCGFTEAAALQHIESMKPQ